MKSFDKISSEETINSISEKVLSSVSNKIKDLLANSFYDEMKFFFI